MTTRLSALSGQLTAFGEATICGTEETGLSVDAKSMPPALTIDQIEQLLLRTRRVGQVFRENGYFEFDAGPSNRPCCHRRLGIRQDYLTVEDRLFQDFGACCRRSVSVEADRHGHSVNSRWRTTVYDLRLGDRAVRNDRQIALRRQNMRRAPIHLDHPTVGPAFYGNPVARPIRSAEIEDDPRKHGTQRALQRQPPDDGYNPGRRQQTPNRQIEDVGDDRKQRADINRAREQILDQLALARSVLGHHEGAHDADQEPGCPQLPPDLQGAMNRIAERHACRLQRLVGDDAGLH